LKRTGNSGKIAQGTRSEEGANDQNPIIGERNDAKNCKAYIESRVRQSKGFGDSNITSPGPREGGEKFEPQRGGGAIEGKTD